MTSLPGLAEDVMTACDEESPQWRFNERTCLYMWNSQTPLSKCLRALLEQTFQFNFIYMEAARGWRRTQTCDGNLLQTQISGLRQLKACPELQWRWVQAEGSPLQTVWPYLKDSIFKLCLKAWKLSRVISSYSKLHLTQAFLWSTSWTPGQNPPPAEPQ